mmetsp:Transcript_34697/g.121003  ORF Transcript_34697/g.121003 Transcript_34697/m.121003 type:complete len:811 (-) Transcript_34697:64-2496(-)
MRSVWHRAPAVRSVRRYTPLGPNAAEIFVANLPRGTTIEEVRSIFSPLCDVRSVRIPTDRVTSQPRAFAFVTIVATDGATARLEAEAARTQMDGVMLNGRKLVVEVHADKAGGAALHEDVQRRAVVTKCVALNKQLVASTNAADILALFGEEGANFNFVNLATALQRLGALSQGVPMDAVPVLRSLVVQATASVSSEAWSARELSNACWGLTRVSAGHAPAVFGGPNFFDAVAAKAVHQIEGFNPQDLANMLWSFSTTGVEAWLLFEAAAGEVARKVEKCNAQALANVVWAYATAGHSAEPLFKAVAVEARRAIRAFNAQDISQMVWAYAKMGIQSPRLFYACAEEFPKRAHLFSAQALANTVWAFATAEIASKVLFEAVALESCKKMDSFTPQNMANTVWAFAKARVDAPLLFEAVASTASKRITTFNAQALSNMVWAFSSAEVEAPELFDAVALESVPRIGAFNSQALANTAWAYATAGVEAPLLFEAVAKESRKKLASFNAQALSNIVWAYSTEAIDSKKLFDAVAAAAVNKIGDFNSQNLASTVHAFSTAGISAPPLFRAVAAEASLRVPSFTTEELANTVWAFSIAGAKARSLYEAVATEAPKRMNSFSPSQLTTILWAYAVVGVDAPALFEQSAERVESLLGGDLGVKELAQLHQVRAYLLQENPHNTLAFILNRHTPYLKAAYLQRDASPSKSKQALSTALERVGWAHDYEHVVEEGLSLCMAQPASFFAFEFDGPSHFLHGPKRGRQETRVLAGETKFKGRLLRQLGWKVAHVPFFEWAALSTAVQQDNYVREKLEALQAPE